MEGLEEKKGEPEVQGGFVISFTNPNGASGLQKMPVLCKQAFSGLHLLAETHHDHKVSLEMKGEVARMVKDNPALRSEVLLGPLVTATARGVGGLLTALQSLTSTEKL